MSRPELKPQQRKALAFAAPKACVGFFMSMRLGKTLSALRWLEARKAYPALIVCPLSVCRIWQQAAYEDGLRAVVLRGTKPELQDLLELERPIFITNWETATKQSDWLSLQGWEAIVADESVKIKSPKAQATKAFKYKYRWIPNRAILSGNPKPEANWLELFGQLDFIADDPGLFGEKNYWTFRDKYFRAVDPFGRFSHDWVPKPGTLEKIESFLVERCIRIGHAEAGVKFESRAVKLYCSLPRQCRKQYQQILRDWATDDREAKHAPVVTGWLRDLCIGILPENPHNAKLATLGDLIEGEMSGQQFICWGTRLAEIERAGLFIQGKGLSVALIDGSVNEKRREAIRKDFQAGYIQAIVANPECAKYGLDFSAANYMVWLSRPWGGDANAQAGQRLFNINKSQRVTIIDIIVEDSLEEDIQELLALKAWSTKAFINKLAERIRKSCPA